MNLYLIRHAAAADRVEFARTKRRDQERPLTAAGRKKMLANARGLRAVVPAFDVLLTSPYARAAETADILAQVFGGPRPEPLQALAPDGSEEDVLAWLHDHRRLESVGLVGHEPLLGTLLAWFVSGSPRPVHELKKGEACMLAWDDAPAPGTAKLVWIATPKMLRKLAR